MKKRLTVFSILIFLLLFSLVSFSEENNPRLRVINNNSPLNTKYGEVLLPKGTIVNIIDKSPDSFTISAEVFGAEVSGEIQAKLVEPFEPASPAASASDKKHAASPPSSAVETEKKETVHESMKYMGKIRDSEFIDYLYENVKDTFVFQNLISKELCLKDKIPSINSIDDCVPLKDGDFLILKGYYSGKMDGKSAIIHIFNESHTVMSQPVLVLLSDKESREEAYKRLVVYSPNSEVQDSLKAGVKYIFREVGSSKIIISKEDFIKMIEAGNEFQFKCPKCEGKGRRKEAGKEKKCTYCKGAGLLSPESTTAAAERDYKKAK